MTTSALGVWTPGDSDDWDLTIDLAATANSIDTVILNQVNAVNRRNVPKVASQAERTALFPTPTQGDRVWRSDLQREEGYYALYSASNLAGRQTAGWAPSASVVIGTGTSITANPPSPLQPLVMSGQVSGTTTGTGAQNWALPNGGFPNGLLSVQLTMVNGSAASSVYLVPTSSSRTSFQTFSPGAANTNVQFSYLAIGW